MRIEYVIEKLLSSLSRLSDKELHQLADLFCQSDVAETFGKIVENILYLRQLERGSRKRSMPEKMHIVRNIKGKRSVRAGDPVKEKFFAFLNDRTLFPSTRDVVEVLNDVFKLGFRYEDYRKQGRKDLIQKCWRNFECMPLTQRRKVLRSLFQRSTNDTFQSEGYEELFRILSQK